MPKSLHDDQKALDLEAYSLEELLDHVDEGVENLDGERIRKTPPYTLASFLNRISPEDCRTILRKVPDLDASEILSEMDADASAEVVGAMREWRVLKILEEFDLDDAADIISELDEPLRVRLLSKLPKEKAEKLRSLLQYDPDTAGGVMNPHYIWVYDNMTVDQGIKHIREHIDEATHMGYVYVIDKFQKLIGVFSLKDLIVAKPNEKVVDIMRKDLKGVCSPQEDKEKIAQAMAELNLYDLPVVDDQGRLLGIVEHDDVLDIIQEEATEDLQKLVGAGADEALYDPMGYSIKRRTPWLFVNLVTALLGSIVISFFQDQIEKIPMLAVFMSAIASLGGNTGQQTLAVAIRSLAIGGMEEFDNFKICLKEALKGIINGILVALVACLAVLVITRDFKIVAVIFIAMILNMGMGGLAGAFIPLMLRRLGFDPAQSSSIFLTGITDICGFFMFLSLGTWMLF